MCSWEGLNKTTFTEDITNVLVRGTPAGDQLVPLCTGLSRL